ncbi:hypothetical protein NPIL_129461 [Nephila pilipes]|uniref:Uncharacterized protein n=1 Tax=Nephila pilipes TaxID=299642 RepID=A0A8X6TJ75_NEPPI|nr:hypothetical protein NPIL_129461 [Nephila pilipes]
MVLKACKSGKRAICGVCKSSSGYFTACLGGTANGEACQKALAVMLNKWRKLSLAASAYGKGGRRRQVCNSAGVLRCSKRCGIYVPHGWRKSMCCCRRWRVRRWR